MLLEELVDKVLDESSTLKEAFIKIRKYLKPVHLKHLADVDKFSYVRTFVVRAHFRKRSVRRRVRRNIRQRRRA